MTYYPVTLLYFGSVTLINGSSQAVKLWPSMCVRWSSLSDGCLGDTIMDGWLCNRSSRGVVVNRTKTYFLLTFVMNWQADLVCVSKCLHTCPKNADMHTVSIFIKRAHGLCFVKTYLYFLSFVHPQLSFILVCVSIMSIRMPIYLILSFWKLLGTKLQSYQVNVVINSDAFSN